MLTFTERRRLVVAAAITLIAVPALLLSGNNSSSSTNTTSIAPTAVSVAPNDSEPADPAFLPENNGSQAPEIITVNVPAALTGVQYMVVDRYSTVQALVFN